MRNIQGSSDSCSGSRWTVNEQPVREHRCEVCGNDYDKTFLVVTDVGESHTFDSFECAVQALAPTCGHGGVRIMGHGVEGEGRVFCCAHCAHQKGVGAARDRA